MARHSIQQLREAQGESRTDLAQMIGVPSETIVDWETGKAEPTAEHVLHLVEHFGIQEHELDLRPEHSHSLLEKLEDLF
jgi:DNA-binding XRE family transcriptional regulator